MDEQIHPNVHIYHTQRNKCCGWCVFLSVNQRFIRRSNTESDPKKTAGGDRLMQTARQQSVCCQAGQLGYSGGRRGATYHRMCDG